jgi:hypothetical protein
MLGLTLREEFRDKRLKGTAIELSNETNTGATQIAAKQFLEITYPTHDILKAIEAVGPDKGRPVIVIGERGLGKSHLMAVLYHAVKDASSTSAWLNSWAATLGSPQIGKIALRKDMLVIGESLHRQRYKTLWDMLFDRHPYGTYIKGKWEGMGEAKTDIPSDQLILELLRHTPTMLLLDEFQTWYDGLVKTKQYPFKEMAFNFIQILSEIAKEHPELLVLVISVRNGNSDASRQVQRVNPALIDFKSGSSPQRMQQDRRHMLLHRLFDNRLQIPVSEINSLIDIHVSEYFRLLDLPSSEQDRKHKEFVESWPYAPHLLQLLEDQVLVATEAQEARDMIRILANLFKSRGDKTPILTAADFRLDDDAAGIGALLDSVANEHHRKLREKALRNIESVTAAVPNHLSSVPHLQEIVGALWLRSIAMGNLSGAEPVNLQADITQNNAIDDNAFQVELATIVDNSFNIHQDGLRLVFREEENPQAKLMSCARNNKLFSDGSDLTQLAKEVRYIIVGADEVAKSFRVIALPKSWLSDPWSSLEESEQPQNWDDRIPILVLPEEPEKINECLGRWVKDHMQKRRNSVRFLLPRSDSLNIFLDRDLIILARAELKAQEWSNQSPEYKKLCIRYQTELRDILKKRYDRFAVLRHWNFSEPSQCIFHVEGIGAQGSRIPEAIEGVLAKDIFVHEDFESFVLEAASFHSSVGKLLRELQEPRPAGQECIPWLGETLMKEHILRLCARGKVAIDLRGTEYLQIQPGEDEDTAWRRLRPKLSYTGRQLDEVFLLQPSAVPSRGSTVSQTSSPNEIVSDVFGGGVSTSLQPIHDIDLGLSSADRGIFGSAIIKPRVMRNNPATSPLNLIGKLENWGIGPATPVTDVTLKIAAANGAQIREILKKLPEGMTFGLSLEKEGDE